MATSSSATQATKPCTSRGPPGRTHHRLPIHDCGTDTASGEGIRVLHNATGTVIDEGASSGARPAAASTPTNAIATTISNCVIRDPGVNGIKDQWATTDTTLCRENTFVGNRVERAQGRPGTTSTPPRRSQSATSPCPAQVAGSVLLEHRRWAGRHRRRDLHREPGAQRVRGRVPRRRP